MAQFSVNPTLTTNAAGSFGIDWTGGMQGTALPDPAARYQLSGGVLASTETLPMWAGVGIYEDVPTETYSSSTPSATLGPTLGRATQVASGAGQLAGFSVSDQSYNQITSPQSPVQLSVSGMSVNYYRFGSNIRLWLAMNSILVDLYGQPTQTQCSWDFVNQQLIPYIPAYTSQAVSSASYVSTTGILSLTFASAPFGAGIGSSANGVPITVTGLTGTGVAALNGTWVITSTGTAGTVINVQATTGLGSLTISGGTLTAGGGAVPFRSVQRVSSGNSMTISYASSTGFATWNRSGSCALVLM